MDSSLIALELWNNGNNCARSTAVGILKTYNDPSYEIFHNAFTTYGGGMGEGSICGSISGSIAAVSKLLHDKGLNDDQVRERIIQMKDHIKITFKTDSLDCKQLLSAYADAEGNVDYNHPERRNRCTDVMGELVRFADTIL